MKHRHWILLASSVGVSLPAMVSAIPVAPYEQTNLVSDILGLAPVSDRNLVNP